MTLLLYRFCSLILTDGHLTSRFCPIPHYVIVLGMMLSNITADTYHLWLNTQELLTDVPLLKDTCTGTCLFCSGNLDYYTAAFPIELCTFCAEPTTPKPAIALRAWSGRFPSRAKVDGCLLPPFCIWWSAGLVPLKLFPMMAEPSPTAFCYYYQVNCCFCFIILCLFGDL